MAVIHDVDTKLFRDVNFSLIFNCWTLLMFIRKKVKNLRTVSIKFLCLCRTDNQTSLSEKKMLQRMSWWQQPPRITNSEIEAGYLMMKYSKWAFAQCITICNLPGFVRDKVVTPKFCQIFQKLSEMEKNWFARTGGRSAAGQLYNLSNDDYLYLII